MPLALGVLRSSVRAFAPIRVAWAALGAASWVLGACGDVTFIDPDAPLKAQLRVESAVRYAVERDPRTYLRVEVPARRGLEGARLLAVGPGDVAFALPLEGQRIAPCRAASTCFELVLGDGVLDGAERVRLEVDRLDHRAEGRLVEERLPPYAVDAEPIAENTRAQILLARDPIGARLASEAAVFGLVPFERTFEVNLTPGACGPTSGATFATLSRFPAEVEARFDESQLACVALRPALPPEGPVVATRTLAARAVARRFQHTYDPPVVPAPLVALLLFDLEIPNPSRCLRTEEDLEATVTELALSIAESDGRGAQVVALPPVELADAGGARCRQRQGPSLSPASLAASVLEALDRAVGLGTPTRILIVYANNLAIESPGLASALPLFREALAAEGVGTYLLAIAPETTPAGLGADDRLPWVSTLEPAFRNNLAAALGRAWPFVSVSHTPSTVVPLADPEMARGLAAYRVCRSEPRVSPRGRPTGRNAWVPGAAGPSYTVALPPQALVPAFAFVRPTVEVRWEGCYALCERPGPGRPPETSWLEEDNCSP